MAEFVAADATPKLKTAPRADATKDIGDGGGRLLFDNAEKPSFLACNDKEYIRQLLVVRKIKELLVSEAVDIAEEDRGLARLGVLNSLRYSKTGHAPPTEAWDELDGRLQGLTRYLKDETGELKRKCLSDDILNCLNRM